MVSPFHGFSHWRLLPGWIDETARFVERAEQTGSPGAAVFRAAPKPGARQPALIEALALLRLSFGARPRPDQGLVIRKDLYRALGGHTGADPEDDLLRRLGRRRITVLRSGATPVRED